MTSFVLRPILPPDHRSTRKFNGAFFDVGGDASTPARDVFFFAHHRGSCFRSHLTAWSARSC